MYLRVIGLTVLLLSCRAVRADAIDLKFHPAKGSVIRLSTTLEQKVTQTVNDMPSTVNQTITLVYRMDAQDVAADGTATEKVTYESVAFKQQSNLGNVEYDSDKPPPGIPAAAKGFAALVGQSVTINVSPTGHVSDVHGVDEMIDTILKRLEIPDGPTKPLLEASLRKDFGPDAVKENMETMLLVYPDHPVNVGDTWTHRMGITKGFPILLDNNFALKEVGVRTATLELKSKLSSNPDAAPVEMGARKLTYQLKGNESGTITLNRTDGMIQSADMQQKVEGKMISQSNEGTTQVPVEIETHIVMRIK